eukprot:2260028-Amphidinium_carterae.1
MSELRKRSARRRFPWRSVCTTQLLNVEGGGWMGCGSAPWKHCTAAKLNKTIQEGNLQANSFGIADSQFGNRASKV